MIFHQSGVNERKYKHHHILPFLLHQMSYILHPTATAYNVILYSIKFQADAYLYFIPQPDCSLRNT